MGFMELFKRSFDEKEGVSTTESKKVLDTTKESKKSDSKKNDAKRTDSKENDAIRINVGTITSKDNIQDSKFVENKKNIFIKPIVDTKLTIFLIENSYEMKKNEEFLKQIVKNSISSEDYVAVINYGSTVRETKPSNSFESYFDKILCSKDITEKKCLYNAIETLEVMVYEYNKKIIEGEKEKTFIKNVEIIGIGSCTDCGSSISKAYAILCFSKIALFKNVSTKYFCFTDATFVKSAEIGFHSIGAINRNYKET
jgi:hypothetical protein